MDDRLDDLPAIALLAEQRVGGQARIAEEYLVEIVARMDAGNRAHLEPRRIHRHDEATDPAFALAAHAREPEHDIGARGVAGPDLQSVHHITDVLRIGTPSARD